MSFLTNAWYMVAWSEEVGASLMRRQIIGVPVLLYRLLGGAVAALEDRCPHRFAPLSRGTRQGDAIQCGYHGLTFDANGRCIHNPFSDRIPPGAEVRRFVIEERDGIVWLWAGDSTKADASRVPRFDSLTTPDGPKPLYGYMAMNAHYEFGTDNLMDLSHIEFVHTGSFAGAGVIFAGKHTVYEAADELHSNWWMPGVKAPGHTFGIYPRDMQTDHWLDMRWQAPATMLLEIGATAAGDRRESGVIVRQAHVLTPETETTSHYFWATSRTSATSTPEGDAMLRGLMNQAFTVEDKPMIEAAYHNLQGEDFWARKPVFLGVDAGGTRARRTIQRLKAAEREDAPQNLADARHT
jgi:phenylpropionate dioxygenase-like ring-hydroxylating dioxygenase large terminal subunit